MHRIRSWARAKAHGPSNFFPHIHRDNSTPDSSSAKDGSTSKTRKENPNEEAPSTEGEDEKREHPNAVIGFLLSTKEILFSSYFNILLIFVPIGIIAKLIGLSPLLIFTLNAAAIVPLAGLLSHSTEIVSRKMGDTIGALMNVTFGNAVELIIFIALQKDELRIVQASLLGSILANLLLILGMCFLIGGLRYREQIYNSTVTQMSACLLSLSVMSLLLPTAFHASFSSSQEAKATIAVLKVSRGTSVVLLIVYGMYLLFQLKSHAYMYESTPQHIIDEESAPGPAAAWMETSTTHSSNDSDSDSSGISHITAKRVKSIIRRGSIYRSKSRNRSRDTTATDEKSTIENVTQPGFFPPQQHINYPSISIDYASEDENIDPIQPVSNPPALPTQSPSTSKETSATVRQYSTPKIEWSEEIEKPRNQRPKRRREKSKDKSSDVGLKNSTKNIHSDSATPQIKLQKINSNLIQDPSAENQGSNYFRNVRLFNFRANIPKSLSQNVFTQPVTEVGPTPGPVPRVRYGIHRTNTLPDRLTVPLHGNPRLAPNVSLTPLKVNGLAVAANASAKDSNHEIEVSRTTSVLILLISTALVAICAEFMVESIGSVVKLDSGLSETFIGLIVLPIIGNAAEHVTAVTVASRNKMDLAIGVAVGSSIQIALFVTPFVVLLGWIMNKELSLYFTLFETVSLFVSAFIVNFLVLDGRSNYLEGALLCAAYVMIAVAAFFYPSIQESSDLGGNLTPMAIREIIGGFSRLL
ncbi:hypothetical protein K3495_g3558 [Podosphaera aphanis]|nr:hypothetical protein K3495_g3558 [Podosphaera aphanis]